MNEYDWAKYETWLADESDAPEPETDVRHDVAECVFCGAACGVSGVCRKHAETWDNNGDSFFVGSRG